MKCTWVADDQMINLFVCGCHATGDIPAVSRCATHGGFVVSAYNHTVQRKVYKHSRMTLVQDSLLNSLRRLPDEKFIHVFSYPEHGLLYAYNWVTPKAWRDLRLEFMSELFRVLKPGGYITFLLDPNVMHTVVYQAHLLGFGVEIRPPFIQEFHAEAFLKSSYSYSDAKMHIVLSKGKRASIPDSGEFVLDTSSILLRHSTKRAKGNKLLALTSDAVRFNIIKKELEGMT